MAIAAAAVLLFWAGVAYQISKPTEATDYRRVLIQVAETAHDAAGTGALITRQQLAGQVFASFAATAYDDTFTALAGAARKLTAQPPADDTTAAMRDRLTPLLQNIVTDLGEAATTGDHLKRRAAAGRLEHAATDLDQLLQQWGAA